MKLKTRTRNASNFECIFSSSTNDIHLELLLHTRTRKWQYVKSDSHTSSFWQKLKKRHIGAPKEKWPFSFSEKSEPKKKRRRLSERQSVKFPTEKYADKWHIWYILLAPTTIITAAPLHGAICNVQSVRGTSTTSRTTRTTLTCLTYTRLHIQLLCLLMLLLPFTLSTFSYY